MQFYLEAGLIILALAFPVSFFAGLSVTIPLAEKRVLIALRENPESYLNYVRDAFLSMILLPVAGLGFSIVGFMREIKHPTGILDKWWHLLTIFGAFFFSLGSIYAFVDARQLFRSQPRGRHVQLIGHFEASSDSLCSGISRGHSLATRRHPLHAITRV